MLYTRSHQMLLFDRTFYYCLANGAAEASLRFHATHSRWMSRHHWQMRTPWCGHVLAPMYSVQSSHDWLGLLQLPLRWSPSRLAGPMLRVAAQPVPSSLAALPQQNPLYALSSLLLTVLCALKRLFHVPVHGARSGVPEPNCVTSLLTAMHSLSRSKGLCDGRLHVCRFAVACRRL